MDTAGLKKCARKVLKVTGGTNCRGISMAIFFTIKNLVVVWFFFQSKSINHPKKPNIGTYILILVQKIGINKLILIISH